MEPFHYKPWEVARLTDYQIMSILVRQSDNVKAMRAETGGGRPGTNTAKMPPPKPSENVRCGAAYEYLISTGMSPEQAERVIRSS